jgi:hypothetical protein
MKKLILLQLTLLFTINIFGQFAWNTYPQMPVINNRTSIKIDNAGNKWVGTTSSGAFQFDGANWISFNTSNSGIVSNSIKNIVIDANNNKWFGTKIGISKYDGTNWTTFNSLNSGLPNDTVNCIFIESGNIWIGTSHGLAKFNGSTWVIYNTSNSGINNNYVSTINKNSNGDLWIGTKAGISVKTSTSWNTYNDQNFYFVSDEVTSIYFENAGATWINTKNLGIFKFYNNVFSPFSVVVQNTDINSYNVTSGLVSFSKGPQGGVLFEGTYNSSSGFYEIVGTQIYFYQFPSGFSSSYHALETSTNKIWFTYSSGSYRSVYSFDYSLYNNEIVIQENVTTGNSNIVYLDINQVRAALLNRGDMFWDLNNAKYEVPKNSGRNSVFASSLWIGGLDNGGSLHQAAMTYRQTGNDYWPGPLDTLTGGTDVATSTNYDNIWKLDRWKIEEFRAMFANGSVTAGTYIPDSNIINWPAHGSGYYSKNLAPFVDVNGDGNYNPLVDGDYPKIKGDQMCYWIFNDNLNPHTESGGLPLKVEVHASAYAYNCDSIADSLKSLNYTTFYDYEIYNRSASNYHDVYLSYWQDPDLGGYNDDYFGCNPSENYSFTYNDDNFDENIGGVFGYGANPPMISNVILNGPLAEPSDGIDNNNNGIIDEAGEKNLMTHVLNYNNTSNPVNGNPSYALEFYNYMHNVWQDGSHSTYGGTGVGGTVPYNFMFDGPLDGTLWSEISENNPSVDRRINMSCGPFNLNSAQHTNFSFAIVWTRDNNPTYNIVSLYNRNLADIRKIKQWYANDNFPSCDLASPNGVTNQTPLESELKLYPNPASSLLYIDYVSDSKSVTIEIYDVRGQLLKQMKMNSMPKQSINIDDLSRGLYLLKVNDGKSVKAQRFVKQ